MAYIAPDSIIRICKNVPLNNTYQDTFYFTNKTDQFSYFLSKAKYTVSEYSYQRQQKKLMVGITADNLYDCNYLVYRNNAFGDKYFYAFITDVEYISNEVSAISFELDVLQTWHFDYNPGMCFVEREHPRTDNAGDNLVPENIETGEFIYNLRLSFPDITGEMVAIFANSFHTNREFAVDKDADLTINSIGKMVNALEFVAVPLVNLSAYIKNINSNGLIDGVVAAFMMPKTFVQLNEDGAHITGVIIEKSISYAKEITGAIDGYTPKCKKLYVSPYNTLMISNYDGNAALFPFEYFSTENCTFSYSMPVDCNPQLLIWPKNFKNILNNYDEKIVLSNFPMVPYISDTFKVWLAQNASSQAVQGLSSAISIVGGAAAIIATKGAALKAGVTAISSGVTGVTNLIVQREQRKLLPDQAHGATGGNAMFAMGLKTVAVYRRTVRGEFAKIIDDYFNKFGYAIHRVKTPDRTSRPEWNYVKTVGANLLGSVPTPDMQKLVSIYDNGVTFWHNPEHIGLYDLDNSPAGG